VAVWNRRSIGIGETNKIGVRAVAGVGGGHRDGAGQREEVEQLLHRVISS
jgi:hypothetical protein